MTHKDELRIRIANDEFLVSENTGVVDVNALADRINQKCDPNHEAPHSTRLWARDGIIVHIQRLCRLGNRYQKMKENEQQLNLFGLYPSADKKGNYKKLDLMEEADFLYNIDLQRRQGNGSLQHARLLEREYERRKAMGLFDLVRKAPQSSTASIGEVVSNAS